MKSIEAIEKILICPRTKNRITINNDNVKVNNSKIIYPIKNGIIDFIPEINDDISKIYDRLSPVYDSLLTSSNIFTKLYNFFVWGSRSDSNIFQKVITEIPDNFSGIILDVPAGTGIFTYKKYQKLKKAKILSIEYSTGMLEQAKMLYEKNNIINVTYIRADVGNLPIIDSSVDILLTMNGFHAFPDKNIALNEITRILKKESNLIGNFYIKGKRFFTDFFINNIYTKSKTFIQPFYTENEFIELIKNNFNVIKKNNLRSIFYFSALKL